MTSRECSFVHNHPRNKRDINRHNSLRKSCNRSSNNCVCEIFIFHIRLDLITQFAKTCLFVAELSFAYFLMLIAMTYNTWLFVAVVIGRGMGYYVVTPLIDTYYNEEETADYSDIRRDSLSLRRKRYPLIQGADI